MNGGWTNRSSNRRRRGGQKSGTDVEQKGIFLTAAVVVVGAFLPWHMYIENVGDIGVIHTEFGVQTGGLVTLVVAVIALGLAWHFDNAKRRMTTGLVGGALISIVALYHLSGGIIGVYVTLVAGLSMLCAGLSGYWKLS